MMHHYNMFGCKWFKSWGDMEESYFVVENFHPYCDPNPNFLQDNPGHDDTPTYQVSLQKVIRFRINHHDNIPWGFRPSLWPWPCGQQSKTVTQHSCSWRCTTISRLVAKGSEFQFIFLYFFFTVRDHCDLDREDRNPIFLHDTPGHGDTLTYQISLQNVKWFRRNRPDKYSLRIWTLNATLTVRTKIQNCHTTYRLMMMHHCTKFDCIRFRKLMRSGERKYFYFLFEPALWPLPWR